MQAVSSVSTSMDEWLSEKAEREAVWLAFLSNGERVIQDDYRPGLSEPIAWLRLKQYCETNKLNIEKVKFKFRSHEELVAEDADGFFFGYSVLAAYGGRNQKSYLTGVVRDGILLVQKWIVPEIIKYPFLGGDMLDKRDPEEYNHVIIYNQV